MDNDILEQVGVLFDLLLNSDQHINNTLSKAYPTLGLTQRNFQELAWDYFITFYKSLVHSFSCHSS